MAQSAHAPLSLSSQLTEMISKESNTSDEHNEISEEIINRAVNQLLSSHEVTSNNTNEYHDEELISRKKEIIRDIQFVRHLSEPKSYHHTLLSRLLTPKSQELYIQHAVNKEAKDIREGRNSACTLQHNYIRHIILKYAVCAESLHPYTILLLFYYCQFPTLLHETKEEYENQHEEHNTSRNHTKATKKNMRIIKGKASNKESISIASSDNADNTDEACNAYILALASILSRKPALREDGLSRSEHLQLATESFIRQIVNVHSNVLASRRFIALMLQTAVTSLYCGALRSVSLITTIVDSLIKEVYGQAMFHFDASMNNVISNSSSLSMQTANNHVSFATTNTTTEITDTHNNEQLLQLQELEEEQEQEESEEEQQEEEKQLKKTYQSLTNKSANMSNQNLIDCNIMNKIYYYDRSIVESLEILESYTKWSLEKSTLLGVMSAHFGAESVMTKEASVREGQARKIITERNVEITPL